MLDNPFTSNILSELIAWLILLAVPSVAAVLWLFFGTLRIWARQNILPLLVGFLIGSLLATSAAFIFFLNLSPSQTQQAVQVPPLPQPPIPLTSEPPTPHAQKPEPQRISRSPNQIIQWYQQFKNPVDGQDMATKRYYGNYVEWEFSNSELLANVGGTYSIRSNIAEAPQNIIVCLFGSATDNPDVYNLENGMNAVVRGLIFRINETSVTLDQCRIVKFL